MTNKDDNNECCSGCCYNNNPHKELECNKIKCCYLKEDKRLCLVYEIEIEDNNERENDYL